MGNGDVSGKPRFEPPPWEREAFEALAARRAEEQVAREALAAAASAAAQMPTVPPATPVPSAIEAPRETGSGTAEAAPETDAADGDGIDVAASAEGRSPSEAAADAAAAAPKVEPRVVDAMLMQLANEERTGTTAALWVRDIVALLLGVLGLGMMAGGISLMQNAAGKQIAIIGALVLSVFGLMFLGMAVWVWIATRRSKGR